MSDHIKYMRHITKDFDEVQLLITEYKNISNQLRTVQRKLRTVESKYKFLIDLIAVGEGGGSLEKATKLLLKAAGFDQVKHLKNVRPRREDLQIWCDDCLILVECKGTKNSVPPDYEISQIKKYIDHRQNIINSKLPVFGLTIINHDNSKVWHKRNKNPIDQNKHEYALAGKYGIITTVELIKGFLLLKNNQITFDKFKELIIQPGNIKFGGRVD